MIDYKERIMKWVNQEIATEELIGEYEIHEEKHNLTVNKLITTTEYSKITDTLNVVFTKIGTNTETNTQEKYSESVTRKYVENSKNQEDKEANKKCLISQLIYCGLLNGKQYCYINSLNWNWRYENGIGTITVKDNKNDAAIFKYNNYEYKTTYLIKEDLKKVGFKYKEGIWSLVVEGSEEQIKNKLKELDDRFSTKVNLYDVKFNGYKTCGSCGCAVYKDYKCSC